MKKLLSGILSFAMVFSCLNLHVYAEEPADGEDSQYYEETDNSEETAEKETVIDETASDEQFEEITEELEESVEQVQEEDTVIPDEPADSIDEPEDEEPYSSMIEEYELAAEASEVTESIPAADAFQESTMSTLVSFIKSRGIYSQGYYFYYYDLSSTDTLCLSYSASQSTVYFIYETSGSVDMSLTFGIFESGYDPGLFMIKYNSTNYYAMYNNTTIKWDPSLTWRKGAVDGSVAPSVYSNAFNALAGLTLTGINLTFAAKVPSVNLYDLGYNNLYFINANVKTLDLNVGQSRTITITPIPSHANMGTLIWNNPNTYISRYSSGNSASVYGESEGTETITVTSSNGETASIKVNCLEPNAFRFDDVQDPDKYYFFAVYWAYKNGITTGTTPRTFEPNTTCTRGHIVTFLWRLAGSPEPTTQSSFVDVKPGSWYEKAVSWAYENGITTGTTPTTFEPTAPCTRAHIVTFLWRYMGEPYSSASMPFKDVKLSAWYGEAVRWAYANGITTGKTDTIFDPSGPCTRGQGVLFLQRTALKNTSQSTSK